MGGLLYLDVCRCFSFLWPREEIVAEFHVTECKRKMFSAVQLLSVVLIACFVIVVVHLLTHVI